MLSGRHQGAASLRQLTACGVLAVLVDIVVTIGLASLDPAYSHWRQYISELGEDGRPYAALFNAWSVVYGFLFAGFGLGSVALPEVAADPECVPVDRRLQCLTALFPCDPGCVGATPRAKVHVLWGYVSLPAITLAPIFAWLAMKDRAAWRAYRAFTLACAAALLVSAGWLGACHLVGRVREGCAVGAAQRLVVGILYLWIVCMAIRLWQIAGKS